MNWAPDFSWELIPSWMPLQCGVAIQPSSSQWDILGAGAISSYHRTSEKFHITLLLMPHSFHKAKNAKECSNYRTIALISHTSKVNLKVLQARLQQCINHELPDIQAGFRKGRGTRDQIANCYAQSPSPQNRENKTSTAMQKHKGVYC